MLEIRLILVGRPDACAEMRQTSNLSPWAVFREGREINTSIRFRIKIVEKSVRERFASEPSEKNSIFSLADATRRRFWSPRPSPERSRAPLWASRTVLGDSPGAPGARRGRSRDAPRRLRDVPERHWASRVGPGTDFKSILGAPGLLPGPILDRFSFRF